MKKKLYQFIKKLVTPFNKTRAFELGIIDEKGKVLKKRSTLKTRDERESYTLSDTLIFNLKKILSKVVSIYPLMIFFHEDFYIITLLGRFAPPQHGL